MSNTNDTRCDECRRILDERPVLDEIRQDADDKGTSIGPPVRVDEEEHLLLSFVVDHAFKFYNWPCVRSVFVRTGCTDWCQAWRHPSLHIKYISLNITHNMATTIIYRDWFCEFGHIWEFQCLITHTCEFEETYNMVRMAAITC